MPRTQLTDLIGKHVTVTNPLLHSASWTGRLIALADDPSFILEGPNGTQALLPQSFTVHESKEPPSECGPACDESHVYSGCCQQGPNAGRECPLPPSACEQRGCTVAANPRCEHCGSDCPNDLLIACSEYRRACRAQSQAEAPIKAATAAERPRIAVLPLPAEPDGTQPFALVISGWTTDAPADTIREQLGARAILIFEQHIDIAGTIER